MRISQTLGPVKKATVELENYRVDKLRRAAKLKQTTVNELLRERLAGWIDDLPDRED